MAPLSFQPWSLEKPSDRQLKDVLNHISLERGHFRDITESSLQEEAAVEGAISTSDSSSEDEDDDDEEEQKAKRSHISTRQELFNANQTMLQQLSTAQHQIAMTVQFMSLLTVEHQSDLRAAETAKTINAAFLGDVKAGMLGTDVWERMERDEKRDAHDATLAHNVKMQSLQHSADSLLGAAKRLEDNVRKETEYWGQLLSITEKGWSVYRNMNKRTGESKLMVRFDFNESLPEFQRNGHAFLNNNTDGSISLQRGIGMRPKGIRVSVCRDGEVVGRSYLPAVSSDAETGLETRIRHARDSIFDEELYREMLEESRTLSSSGVLTRGSAIELPAANTHSASVQLDLVSLDDETGTSINASNADDALAQAIAISARLLLSQSHRDKLRQRSEVPPPVSERKVERPVLQILRPIMSFLRHLASIESVNNYLSKATSLLEHLKVDSKTSQARIQLPHSEAITNAETLATALKATSTSSALLTVMASGSAFDLVLSIRVESSALQTYSSFVLRLPNDQELFFKSAQDFTSTCDGVLAWVLATILSEKMGQDWVCDPKIALITKEVGVGEKASDVELVVNSQEGVLKLISDISKKEVALKVGETGKAEFWDAWMEVL